MNSVKYFILFILVFIFLLFSCTSTPLPSSASVTVPEDFFGLVHAGRTKTSDEFRVLDEMGIVWVLKTFGWADIEPEKGIYDFSRYDSFVDATLKNGHKIAVTLGYESQWIRNEVGKQKYIPSHYISDFLNYIEATVIHYKGKVHAWQIWNEPNWIFWKGSDREFFELSKQAAQRIRETDSDAFIIGGGFSGAPVSFIKNMHKTGAMENLNAISFHPYGINPYSSMLLHDTFLKVISDINFKGEVWITEVGYPTGGLYPSKVSLNEFPSYVIKTVSGSAARGIRVLFWYQLFDSYLQGQSPNNYNSEIFFGLVYRDYTKKDGAFAYQLCAQYLPGSRYMPQLPLRENVSSNIVSFCFLEGVTGSNILIIWNDKKSTQKIKVTLSSPITLHNISTGVNIILEDNSIIDVTNKPVFITWKGETYPQISHVTGKIK